MLILPRDRTRRLRFFYRKNIRSRFDFLVFIGYFGSLASIAAFTFKGLLWEPGNRLYICFLSTFALIALLYCRNYYKEKHQRYKYQDCYKRLHHICHELRSVLVFPSGNNFVDSFERCCGSISSQIYNILTDFGYKIDDVCIKLINVNKGELRVISRANNKRILADIDNNEKISDNPFVGILLRVHTKHNGLLSENDELMKIPQNQSTNDLSFLAIGNIRSKKMPMFVDRILPKEKSKPEYTQDAFLSNMRKRIGDRYNSCAGLLVTMQPDKKIIETKSKGGVTSQELLLEHYIGMLGFDSKDPNLFEYFDLKLFQLIASITDMLYPGMLLYQKEIYSNV